MVRAPVSVPRHMERRGVRVMSNGGRQPACSYASFVALLRVTRRRETSVQKKGNNSNHVEDEREVASHRRWHAVQRQACTNARGGSSGKNRVVGMDW